jgi:hypothetical protein
LLNEPFVNPLSRDDRSRDSLTKPEAGALSDTIHTRESYAMTCFTTFP